MIAEAYNGADWWAKYLGPIDLCRVSVLMHNTLHLLWKVSLGPAVCGRPLWPLHQLEAGL